MVCISVFLSVVLQMFVFVFDILENCFDWSVSHPEMTSFTVYEITAAHKHTLISLWSYLYPHKGLVLWLKHCVPNRIKVMIVYGFNLKSVHWSLMKQDGCTQWLIHVSTSPLQPGVVWFDWNQPLLQFSLQSSHVDIWLRIPFFRPWTGPVSERWAHRYPKPVPSSATFGSGPVSLVPRPVPG